MSLQDNRPCAFIPTNNAEAARAFYEHTIGLRFESDDQFALVFRVGPERNSEPGTMLRVVRVGEFTPAQFTIFGWEVERIEDAVKELTAKGVDFLRFGFFEQDDLGIWSSPSGAKVAWFKDPDGNTLSVAQH
jgi:catechol 2,3-dioxygenase-like lactoylglutathione lyase family enzyme